jgi:hypothetical protein
MLVEIRRQIAERETRVLDHNNGRAWLRFAFLGDHGHGTLFDCLCDEERTVHGVAFQRDEKRPRLNPARVVTNRADVEVERARNIKDVGVWKQRGKFHH